MILKKNKKKGILFFVTGLSGSGKTTIAQKIKKNIIKLHGPTILVSGDNLRKIFNFYGYTYNDRLSNSRKFCKFAKFITNQNINLIFAAVGMMDSMRSWYRKNVDNYLEIYIKSDVKKIIKFKKKRIYFKNNKNIVGLDIKPQLPKKSHITINNNFTKSTDELVKILLAKIKKIS